MAAILSQVRSTVEDSFPAKPTPEQLNVSAPMREAQRKKISDMYDHISNPENESLYKNLNRGIEFLNRFKSYLKDELAWWNANIELTPEAVKKRSQQEKERIDEFMKEYASLSSQASAKQQEEKAAKQKKIQETLTRGWIDDVSDAVKIALGSALVIFWVLLGIRLGGLVANDLLYKPIAYRALAFIYSFLFLPILLPYWVYREISYLFFKGAYTNAPHFESIFPVVPYDPSEPLTLEKRLYGYPNTPALKAWIVQKQQEEQQSWLSVLGGGLLNRLYADRTAEQQKA